MIKIKHFDHISTASQNQKRELNLFTNFFGFNIRTEWHSEEGFNGIGFDVPGKDRVGWELLVPDNSESYLHTFLKANKGVGVHHVSMQIDSAEQAIKILRENSIEPLITNDGSHHNVYIHPKRGGSGLLFQLFEGDPWNDPSIPEPSFTHSDNTLGIKKIHHIGQAVMNQVDIQNRYGALFGYHSVMKGPRKKNSDFITNVMQTQTNEIHWELISPTNEKSFIKKFINERGEGVHHVTFIVENWEKAMNACYFHNIDTFDLYKSSINGAAYLECFLHPKDTAGMLVQLVWEEKEGIWL
ncbi:MAG: methylmalonyl-CoA/ethylmalonyl-CoA epimerase [Chloroflexi bacterium]|jgi:methylmalonyl-CoA epimerase|nr:MAG: methylmalonyl-CoA/ethylmalonyl-CoA epimerase [Chloroflexota bacterium]|tara:strand:+ start:1843 stop:2736 length:894 start_codon:yes stop_codon:yes gene_type:complete